MSDKKISGVRKDISIKEFKRRLGPETPQAKREKRWNKFKGILDFLGLINDDSSASGKISGYNSIGSGNQTSGQDFRATHRVETPQRSHEDWVREEIAKEAYMKMVDGKGDCDHHER